MRPMETISIIYEEIRHITSEETRKRIIQLATKPSDAKTVSCLHSYGRLWANVIQLSRFLPWKTISWSTLGSWATYRKYLDVSKSCLDYRHKLSQVSTLLVYEYPYQGRL
jgi:hypothetical protein